MNRPVAGCETTFEVDRILREVQARRPGAKLRFTPARRRVLEVLLEEGRPLGAYRILERLRGEGRAAQPPAAYRALDFLVRHGFAYRIERLNAYVASTRPQCDPSPVFMICRLCGSVAEIRASAPNGALADMAKAQGFRIERTVIEAMGVCLACRSA